MFYVGPMRYQREYRVNSHSQLDRRFVTPPNSLPLQSAKSLGPVTDRANTQLYITTKHGTEVFSGTCDGLMDMAAEIMMQVYNWILTNGHSDWLNDPDEIEEMEKQDHARNEG
jgi:hypothetical protein